MTNSCPTRPSSGRSESVDRAQRDGRDVDALSRRAIGQPVPIEQRERRVAAETAQIDRRAAADIDAIRPRDIEADAGLLTPTEALRDRAYYFAERRLADRKSTRLNSSH